MCYFYAAKQGYYPDSFLPTQPYGNYSFGHNSLYEPTFSVRNDFALNKGSQTGMESTGHQVILLQDYGKRPLVVDIEKASQLNDTFRTALWTGKHFQVTLMRINVGDDIGLEVHPNTDQFIRIEEGQGLVQMGDSKDNLDFVANASEDYASMVPAGKWHNLTNTGDKPLKVSVIYAPPQHPFGTVHLTKADAMAAE